MNSPRCVIISPVRNEDKFLQRTIDSLTAQTLRPQLWIIVNDGSTDQTGEIAERAAEVHEWIKIIHRPDRGFRKSGSGVMDAFYEGYKQLQGIDWDIIAKLDGDLEFAPDFLDLLFKAFAADESLGITGGDIYHYENGNLIIESKTDPAFHVRGATKFYTRHCWDQIGGLMQVTGWDTLDEVKAVMLGWRTYRIEDAKVLHLRPTGAADGGLRNAFKNGRGSYIAGYHPLFILSKCIRRLVQRPVLLQSFGLFAGFFSSYLCDVQQIKDRELIRYLRKQQVRRLIGLPTVWR